MKRRSGRRAASLTACVVTVFAAFLALAAVSLASTPRASAPAHHPSKPATKKHRKRRAPAKPLTRAQILKLIQDHEKPGPSGATGATGATGSTGGPGADGAVAGYSATESGGPFDLSNSSSTVVSKQLPAGIFIVHAKVVLNANAAAAGNALAECDLLSGGAQLDTAQWDQPLSPLILNTVYAAATSLPVQAGLRLTSPSTVSLQCFMTGPSVQLTANSGQLQAVQVNTAA